VEFRKELENETGDLIVLFIEREMAGVEQMDFGVGRSAWRAKE